MLLMLRIGESIVWNPGAVTGENKRLVWGTMGRIERLGRDASARRKLCLCCVFRDSWRRASN